MIDNEIKRLLKLESIKGFQLLDSEKQKLAEWKANQKPVKAKKVKAPKGFTVMDGMGANGEPTIVENKTIKIDNVVVDKETGEIEE